MKKILSLSALAVGVITLASCSDFLDQTSPSELSNTTVYGSTYYTGLRVNQIYGGMGQDRTYAQDFAITSNLNSDIEFVDGVESDSYRETGPRSEGNFYMDPGYSRLGDRWTDMYGIIEDCNDVIEGVRTSPLFAEDAPEHDEMGRYLGEALAILRPIGKGDLSFVARSLRHGDVSVPFGQLEEIVSTQQARLVREDLQVPDIVLVPAGVFITRQVNILDGLDELIGCTYSVIKIPSRVVCIYG